MNNKISILVLFVLGFMMVQQVTAQSSSSIKSSSSSSVSVSSLVQSSTSSTTSAQVILETLKEKVATQVAALSRENNKILAGTITKKESDILTLIDNDEKVFSAKYDSVSVWQNAQNIRELKSDDIKVGDYMILEGFMIDDVLQVNTGYKDSTYIIGHGNVSGIDGDKNIISIAGNNLKNTDVKAEVATKFLLYNQKTKVLDKTSPDKLIAGDSVHFMAVSKNKVLTAQKIIIIPQELFIKKDTTTQSSSSSSKSIKK
jgi:hypothetical protein